MCKLYRDIFDDSFLDKFGKYKDKVGNIKLTTNAIDVIEICKVCSISLASINSFDSGRCINDNTKSQIEYSSFEPEYRQRFTIANELGLIMLGHEGISYRTEDQQKYKDVIEKAKETLANRFAADLLMPKVLVIKYLRNAFKDYNLDLNEAIGKIDYDLVLRYTAKKLNVSIPALSYRIKHLELIK